VAPRAGDVVGGGGVRVRPLTAADLGAASALLLGAFAISRHAERVLELLRLAAQGNDAECRGLVAAVGSRVVGVALYGIIAGTVGGGKIHLIASDGSAPRGEEAVRARLLDEVVARLTRTRARYARAELPEDPCFLAMRGALASAGFAEEGRVNDLSRDGVALVFLSRDLHPRGTRGRP
jgi:hypothetical protein